MIKSLYTRVVLTYLISVIGGTVISFNLAIWIYKDELNENLQVQLMRFAQDVVQIYDAFPLTEADKFVSGMKQLETYHVRIYDANGGVKSYGGPAGMKLETVTAEQVKQVLAGTIVQVNPTGISISLLGLKLTTDTGKKALFVEPVGAPLPPLC